MSAFTECDNPFSMESDPLEQCLKSMCVEIVNVTQLEYLSRGWAAQVTQKLSKPRWREWREGGSQEKTLIFIDMCVKRVWTQRLVDKVCVCVCIYSSSTKTCRFADNVSTSSISLPLQFQCIKLQQIHLLIPPFLYSYFPLPAPARQALWAYTFLR